jgi:hypothetical protein
MNLVGIWNGYDGSERCRGGFDVVEVREIEEIWGISSSIVIERSSPSSKLQLSSTHQLLPFKLSQSVPPNSNRSLKMFQPFFIVLCKCTVVPRMKRDIVV